MKQKPLLILLALASMVSLAQAQATYVIGGKKIQIGDNTGTVNTTVNGNLYIKRNAVQDTAATLADVRKTAGVPTAIDSVVFTNATNLTYTITPARAKKFGSSNTNILDYKVIVAAKEIIPYAEKHPGYLYFEFGSTPISGTLYILPGVGRASVAGTIAEKDSIFKASPAGGITGENISKWNTASSWGNHAGLYQPLGNQLLSTFNVVSFKQLIGENFNTPVGQEYFYDPFISHVSSPTEYDNGLWPRYGFDVTGRFHAQLKMPSAYRLMFTGVPNGGAIKNIEVITDYNIGNYLPQIVNTFNGRSGTVTPQPSDYSLYYAGLQGANATGKWNIDITGQAQTIVNQALVATSNNYNDLFNQPTNLVLNDNYAKRYDIDISGTAQYVTRVNNGTGNILFSSTLTNGVPNYFYGGSNSDNVSLYSFPTAVRLSLSGSGDINYNNATGAISSAPYTAGSGISISPTKVISVTPTGNIFRQEVSLNNPSNAVQFFHNLNGVSGNSKVFVTARSENGSTPGWYEVDANLVTIHYDRQLATGLYEFDVQIVP